MRQRPYDDDTFKEICIKLSEIFDYFMHNGDLKLRNDKMSCMCLVYKCIKTMDLNPCNTLKILEDELRKDLIVGGKEDLLLNFAKALIAAYTYYRCLGLGQGGEEN